MYPRFEAVLNADKTERGTWEGKYSFQIHRSESITEDSIEDTVYEEFNIREKAIEAARAQVIKVAQREGIAFIVFVPE